MSESTRGSLWPFLAVHAAAAAWITFAGIHHAHNSDSLLFTLASVHHWTPFFWEQDRVGMFVPLIASVCPDPVLNLVLQTGLTAFAGLCVPLLLVELIYPNHATRSAVTAVNAAMLAIAPDLVRNNLLYECYYPTAMALGCAGLLVLGRGPGWPRWLQGLTAAALLGLAHWVYLGLPLWLGPLVLLRGWFQPGEPLPRSWWRIALRPALHPRTVVGLVLIIVSFAVGLEQMRIVREANPGVIGRTPRHALPEDAWVESWVEFADHVQRLPGMTTWEAVLGGLAAAGVIGTTLLWRKPGYPIVAAVPVLLAPAAAEFLDVGTRFWTALNDHHPRYLLGSAESIQAFAAMVAALPFTCTDRRPVRLALGGCAGLALFAAATYRYGLPSPSRPRHDVDALAGRYSGELLAADVDAFGGDYWTVWPTVYHANLLRQEAGGGPMIYGAAARGRVFHAEWVQRFPGGMRVAVPNNPRDRQEFLIAAPLIGLGNPVKIGERGPFEVYLARPTPLPTT